MIKNTKKSTSKLSSSVIPLSDRVLILEINEVESKTASGIYLPKDVAEDKGVKKGLVVEVGQGRYDQGKLIPMQIKKGDKVLFGWGDLITVDGKEYHLVRESEISAIIK